MGTQLTLVEEYYPDLSKMKRIDLPAIWQGFQETFNQLAETAQTLTVTDASQTSQMTLARTTRLALRQVRIQVEHKRTELGEEALRRKQDIDHSAKRLRELIEPLEERLLQQEQFVEIQEKKRLEQLKLFRVAKLRPLGIDCSLYNLELMPEGEFDRLFQTSKIAQEQREQAKVDELTRRIETQTLERANRKKQEQENERLRVEAEAASERARIAEEALKEEQKKETQRLAAEQAEVNLRAERERKLVNAPDKEKLTILADQVEALVLPAMNTTQARAIGEEIKEMRGRFLKFIVRKAEEL